MDAKLSDLLKLGLVSSYQVESQQFQKRVSVLWSELNRKLQVLPSLLQVIVLVVRVLGHVNPGTFTPNFS